MLNDMKHLLRRGLIAQTYILIIIGVTIIGIFTYVTQYQIAKETVRSRTRERASEAVGAVVSSIKEYPAYDWLLSYWAEHAEELDIEYDASFTDNTVTKEKCELFAEHCPGVQLKYCDRAQLETLDSEDQKLYAEIVYSWLITRINNIKQDFGCNYLYCVMTDTEEGENPYDSQLFLMSAADPGAERGTQYEQVYTLGVTVDVSQGGTREAMRKAVERASSGDDGKGNLVGETMYGSGRYIDFYSVIELFDKKAVLVGVTYYQAGMIRDIRISTLWHSLVAMLYQILLIHLVMRHIFLYMLRPLKKVLLAIRSYTATKDSKAIETDMTDVLSGKNSVAVRHNEIGQLAEDMVVLAKEIDNYTAQIETAAAARERIQIELETAARIQTHMLPNANPYFQDHPEFKLSASMISARDVGGDFYDYFFVDNRHLVLVIADVSDKGVPSALFMAQAKALIMSRSMTGEEPGQILSYVNNQLCENNDAGYFVTVWLAVIDMITGEGIAANAGHEHPALCRKGETFDFVIYKHDLALGLIRDKTFRQHSFKLSPGDRLFVYTDGVTEASDMSQEQFGSARLLEALNSVPDASPGELLKAVNSAVDAFMGGASRFDDTTMMCIRYKGMPGHQEDGNE